MKCLIAGDYHIYPLHSLEKLIEKEKAEMFISLGDFDRADLVEHFMEIAAKLRQKGIEVIDIPGNHEHAILNNIEIDSESLRELGKDFGMLNQEFQDNPRVKLYLENLLKPENLIRRFQIGKFNAVIVHGGYDGDLSKMPSEVEEQYFKLWYRIIDEQRGILSRLDANFKKMEENGENLMIRGHDHYRFHGQRKSGITSYEFNKSEIELQTDSAHIIMPGAFYDCFYAIIENNGSNLMVTYGSI